MRAVTILLFAALLISCGKHYGLENPDLGRVTFYNESSYSVTIHQTSFSGPVLKEKLASGNPFSTEIRPSDNYGIGDVFSIEYFFMVANGNEVAGGDVWTGGLVDPNAQIIQNIEAGKSYTIHIPNPAKWESSEAFVKIANKSSMPIEFNHLGLFYRLDESLETTVPSGKVGIYRVYKTDPTESSVEISNRTITQVFERYPIPDFTAVDGYIYTFEFNGNEVKKTGEKKL